MKQGLIQQVLGVVQLEVDSAGSKKKEVAIYAISRQIAEDLKEQLASYKKETFDSEENLVDGEFVEEKETILQLSFKDLLTKFSSQAILIHNGSFESKRGWGFRNNRDQ